MEPRFVKMVNNDNLLLWSKTIFDDEFNDKVQNAARGDANKVDGEEALDLLEAMVPAPYGTLAVGCGGGHRDALYRLDPSALRGGTDGVVRGWMESMPFTDGALGRIICWGTFCFLRSPIEALMEANRVLTMGGVLIFDVVLSTTFALCQTVDGSSFVNHLRLHGFEIYGRVEFGPAHHHRMGICAVKTRHWDPAYFRMPQAESRPNNYLKARDWPLWGE